MIPFSVRRSSSVLVIFSTASPMLLVPIISGDDPLQLRFASVGLSSVFMSSKSESSSSGTLQCLKIWFRF
jgi:hypothetical protein